MSKCINCRHFKDKGSIKGKNAYYCDYSGSSEFVCYGHPVKPIIPLHPYWCPIKERKVSKYEPTRFGNALGTIKSSKKARV